MRMRADDQEVDAWWGAYSPWTMLPSWLITSALFLAILTFSTIYLSRNWARHVIFWGGGAVVLFQTLRWIHRIFGWTYRVTTKRLLEERGIISKHRREELATGIERVTIDRVGLAKLVGVGRVLIYLKGHTEPWIWEGLRRPEAAQKALEEVMKKQAPAG